MLVPGSMPPSPYVMGAKPKSKARGMTGAYSAEMEADRMVKAAEEYLVAPFRVSKRLITVVEELSQGWMHERNMEAQLTEVCNLAAKMEEVKQGFNMIRWGCVLGAPQQVSPCRLVDVAEDFLRVTFLQLPFSVPLGTGARKRALHTLCMAAQARQTPSEDALRKLDE